MSTRNCFSCSGNGLFSHKQMEHPGQNSRLVFKRNLEPGHAQWAGLLKVRALVRGEASSVFFRGKEAWRAVLAERDGGAVKVRVGVLLMVAEGDGCGEIDALGLQRGEEFVGPGYAAERNRAGYVFDNETAMLNPDRGRDAALTQVRLTGAVFGAEHDGRGTLERGERLAQAS